jgi:peptidoglycan/LPS O-acetylase OafA/YrhL
LASEIQTEPTGAASRAKRRGAAVAEASPYGRHIPALDGLRGVAVLAVMASHLFGGQTTGTLSRVVQQTAAFGATGVALFFVLSGFLITGILYDSLGDPHFFRKFYARRTLRIFPLYYGVLILFAVGGIVLHQHYGRELASCFVYLQNTWLIAPPIWAYDGLRALPLDHFWSLAIEEQFYLVWPLAVFLVRGRRRLMWTCGAGVAVSVVARFLLSVHGVDPHHIRVMTICSLDMLLGGGLLALLLRGRMHDRVLRAVPWIFVASSVLYFGLQRSWDGPRWTAFGFTADTLALAIAFTTLLGLALRRGGWTERGFSAGWLRVLGKYSYGLYVIHRILAAWMLNPLRAVLLELTHSKVIAAGVGALAIGALSFAAAWLSYNFYEKRFLQLKRYFEYKPKERFAEARPQE